MQPVMEVSCPARKVWRIVWRRLAALGLTLVVPAYVASWPSPARAHTPIERCWFVVFETAAPVNLPKVDVSVTAAKDPTLHRVVFRRADAPRKIVTELEVTRERLAELFEDMNQRRAECAGSPQ